MRRHVFLRFLRSLRLKARSSSNRKVHADATLTGESDKPVRDIQILNAHPVRFIERNLPRRSAAGRVPYDDVADLRESIPVEHTFFDGWEQVAAFIARGAARIDADV